MKHISDKPPAQAPADVWTGVKDRLTHYFEEKHIDAATARGVMVANAPTSNIHSACEHAISLLLSTARQIPAADKTLRDGEWKRSSFKGVEILGKTIGIVGFGHIGQLFAQRLAAFETEIIAYDPYANPARAAQLHAHGAGGTAAGLGAGADLDEPAAVGQYRL